MIGIVKFIVAQSNENPVTMTERMADLIIRNVDPPAIGDIIPVKKPGSEDLKWTLEVIKVIPCIRMNYSYSEAFSETLVFCKPR
jgi:hypothetical protein